MKKILAIAIFLAFGPLCHSADGDVRLILKFSIVNVSSFDLCDYQVGAKTVAMKSCLECTSPVNAEVSINWTVTDQHGFSTGGSGGGSASATDQAEATFEREGIDLPSYGNWNAGWTSKHVASGGNTTIEEMLTDSNSLPFCDYVATGPDAGCSQLLTKQGAGPDCDGSPLVLDLLKDGFFLGSPDQPVTFDIQGNGSPRQMLWVAPESDDGFLFQDLNSNGICDDGTELFGVGSQMLLEVDRSAPNGFVALGQYDDRRLGGNFDGVITQADQVWQRLSLWVDENADAICTPEEVHQLDWWDLAQFEIYPKDQNLLDPFGNWFRYWAKAHEANGEQLDLVDIYFQLVDNDFGN